MTEQKISRRFDGIQVLRCWGAISVLLYHVGFGFRYAKAIDFSATVHLFFCISAFLMMYTTRGGLKPNFLRGKLIRFLPLYWLLTVLTFVASKFIASFGQSNITIPELLKSMFLIPYFRGSYKSDLVARPIVGPAWTMVYEIWFLIAFWVAAKLWHKRRGEISIAVCVIAILIGKLLPNSWPVTVVLDSGYWLSFAAGIVVFFVWEQPFMQSFAQKKHSVLWLVPVLGLLVVLHLYALPGSLGSLWALLIVALVLALTADKPIHPVFNAFGKVSYSFYLIHYYVIMILSMVINFDRFSLMTCVGTVLVIGVTLGLSIISYHLIEQGIGKFLKKYLCK